MRYVILFLFAVDVGIQVTASGECPQYLHGQCMPERLCPMTHGRAHSFCGNDVCCIAPEHLNGGTTDGSSSGGTGGTSGETDQCSKYLHGQCMPEANCPITHGRAHSLCGSDVCCIAQEFLHLNGSSSGASGGTSGGTSQCATGLSGSCISLSDQCPLGYGSTLSFCGFQEQCCIPPSGIHLGGSVLGQTGSNGGGSGPFGSGGSVNTSYSTLTNRQCGISDVGQTAATHRITGGNIAQHGEFPWQISLMLYGYHTCGGTLIDAQWVVTAAHCFHQSQDKTQFTVGVGLQDRNQIPQSNVYHVSELIIHELYNADAHQFNDIALLKLSKPVDLSGKYVRKACLPAAGSNFENHVCIVSGWGAHTYNPAIAPIPDKILNKAVLTILPKAQCDYFIGRSMYDTNYCAGENGPNGFRDVCQGDSGGPFVCYQEGHWELVGIPSYNFGCGYQQKLPAVYTKVSSYLDWIHQKMQTY